MVSPIRDPREHEMIHRAIGSGLRTELHGQLKSTASPIWQRKLKRPSLNCTELVPNSQRIQC
jgi:hypothetical protein